MFDVLRAEPKKIAVKVCLPLVIVTVISWFTTSIVNILYGKYGGLYFAVQGLIGVVISTISTIVNAVISSAWIKTAPYYTKENTQEKTSYFATSVYAIMLVEFVLLILCLVAKNYIFSIFHIPEELYEATNLFYIVSLFAYVIAAIGFFGLTLVNGVGTPKQIFISNLLSTCGTIVTSAIFLWLFKGGIWGAALVTPLCGLMVLIYAIIVFKNNKIKFLQGENVFRMDWKLFLEILRTGLLMAGQVLLCQVGEIFISIQTNKYLSVDCISVLSVSLPLTGVLSAFSTACMVFIPANYTAGQLERVKKFFWIMLIGALAYGFLCCVMYILIGEWYYSTVFEDYNLVQIGATYWRIYGTAIPFVALIFVIRYFFDCVGYHKTAFCAGIAQVFGCLICAFILIPYFGELARFWCSTISFICADVYLIVSYLLLRKSIYKNKSNVITSKKL